MPVYHIRPDDKLTLRQRVGFEVPLATPRLTSRTLWTAIVGSMRSLRSPRRRASVRSSSAPASQP